MDGIPVPWRTDHTSYLLLQLILCPGAPEHVNSPYHKAKLASPRFILLGCWNDWSWIGNANLRPFFVLRILLSSILQTYNTSCLTEKVALLSPLKTVCYNKPPFAAPHSKWNYEKLSCHPRQPGHSICSTYNTFDIWKLSKLCIVRNDNELNVFNG